MVGWCIDRQIISGAIGEIGVVNGTGLARRQEIRELLERTYGIDQLPANFRTKILPKMLKIFVENGVITRSNGSYYGLPANKFELGRQVGYAIGNDEAFRTGLEEGMERECQRAERRRRRRRRRR
uniref:H15 domain-containing protein n=1 Tax=Oryza punctata TaxID=4537 RepID=A0A0E0KMD1_ORYPU